MTRKIGRFEIRRELGRGAQSVVYLAFDPQLEREVALKTLHFERPDPAQNATLLAEARMVGKLRHPGIVPIFEAGEEGGDLFLVFEYVPGENLAVYLRRQGALPPARAAALIVDVLDAVAHAHAHGIIHRDLKPSNILMDETGVPRVMDFGIATHVAEASGGQQEFTGTPAYMAPEYISSRLVSERTDVFAAGLILFEMLTGQRAVQGDNIYQIMHRIANESLELPGDDGNVRLDDRLGNILLKGTARDPQQRYESALQFRQALEAYLAPAEDAAAQGGSPQSTVDFLLRRLRHKGDFPALSESVSAINKIASSETESISRLSSSILKDFSLTNKILRLVNSAHYRQAGGGNISTVSRAIIVLGFDAVRNIAVTVLLFEHLQNKANANQLKEEFLRANLAGLLSKDIAIKLQYRDQEQPFICAVFHNLGRLLSQYYFPEESEEIRKVMLQKDVSEQVAALQVLGVSFEDLGIGIARNWGFPQLIVSSMRQVPSGPVRKPNTPEERLQVLSAFSNEVCQAIASAAAEDRDKEIRKISGRFAASVPMEEKELKQTIHAAVEEVTEFARIIRVNLQQTQFGRQLRKLGGDAGAPRGEDTTVLGEASLEGTVLAADGAVDTASFGAEGEKAHDAQAVLTAGIQDISNTLVEGFKLNDILRIILETMYRAMGFRRVVLCIKDAKHNVMQGRFGFGPEANELAKQFRFTLSFTPDIFHAATSKGVDILISDIDDPKIASRIPDWYRKAVTAKTFVVFPLNIKTNPVALIYADREEAGGIEISEKELSLLRTLRNQAVLAIKQVS